MNACDEFDIEQRLTKHFHEPEPFELSSTFEAAVIARIRRRFFVRCCVIGTAATIGLLIAFFPFLELLQFGFQFLPDASILSAEGFGNAHWMFVAGGLALLSPVAFSLIER